MSYSLEEEKEYFIITWRVKNFSIAAAEVGEVIVSPNISVSKFGNSEWNLVLYPKGDDDDHHCGFIACYIRCHNMGNVNIDRIEINMTLVPKSSKKRPNIFDFELYAECGEGLITLEDIFNEKNKYLPNDTITVECYIRCIDDSHANDIKKDMLETLAKKYLSGNNSYNVNKCCIETSIHVHTKSTIWPVQNFLSLLPNKRVLYPVFSAVKGVPTFYVTLYKVENSVQIEIITKENTSSKKIFVRCHISVINTQKGNDVSREDDFLFHGNSSQVWKFPKVLDYNELKRTGYFEHTRGVLYLQLNMALNISCKMHHIEKDSRDHFLLPSTVEVPVKALTSDTEHAVVTLKVGSQSFKVHRSILEARSEVFTAMFENEMKEKHTGIVEIQDVDPEILGQMVAFFYTGTTGDLQITDVEKLYAVSDKYQVLSLMDHCSSNLMSSLTESNVCNILCLADLHQDERLLKCAEDFVVDNFNADGILVCQDWKILMEKNPSVAANIMYKMLVK